MTSRYCLLHQLGACRRSASPAFSWTEPLRLSDGRRHYRLDFDCRRCVMSVYLENAESPTLAP
jgi:putative protease